MIESTENHERDPDPTTPTAESGEGIPHTSTENPADSSELQTLEKEVAEAMAAMDPSDLAELTGEVGPEDSVEPGTPLTGTIVGITDDDIFLEFGVKSQGILPRSQFGKKEVLEIGRKVDVEVDRYDRDLGMLVVNRQGEIRRATWTTLAEGQIVEGRVTGLNKGGLEVDLKGIRAFMPASQVDVTPLKDISVLLNEVVRAEVIEVDRRNKNVLLSRRKVMKRERKEIQEKLRAELEVDQVKTGVVKNITDFGAFVDIGGVEGLLHISDISWGQVEKVSDHFETGQEIKVKILKLNEKRDRISLGFKQVQPDPWEGVAERYPVGTALKARVLRVASFGAFAELEAGVEGLIPISEMSWTRIHSPQDVVSTGDVVDAVVIRVEPEKRRLALSLKQALSDPWAGVLEGFEADSLVKGTVRRIEGFGAFVELTPGVEGLIHISEMADRRVKNCEEVVKVGEEVEVRVLSVDLENRRISLSIKKVKEAVVGKEDGAPDAPAKPAKKRKKPLKGGLSSHWDWAGSLELSTDDL